MTSIAHPDEDPRGEELVVAVAVMMCFRMINALHDNDTQLVAARGSS